MTSFNVERAGCRHQLPAETKDRCPTCRRMALRCKHAWPYEGENACPTCGPAFEAGFEAAAEAIADFVDVGSLAGSIQVLGSEPIRAAAARAVRRAFVRAPHVRTGKLEPSPGGTFRVVKVDPEGSGIEWSGHLGKTVHGAERCCGRCTVIFGYLHGMEIGPFVPGELLPLDDEARRIQDEIEAFAKGKDRGA